MVGRKVDGRNRIPWEHEYLHSQMKIKCESIEQVLFSVLLAYTKLQNHDYYTESLLPEK